MPSTIFEIMVFFFLIFFPKSWLFVSNRIFRTSLFSCFRYIWTEITDALDSWIISYRSPHGTTDSEAKFNFCTINRNFSPISFCYDVKRDEYEHKGRHDLQRYRKRFLLVIEDAELITSSINQYPRPVIKSYFCIQRTVWYWYFFIISVPR